MGVAVAAAALPVAAAAFVAWYVLGRGNAGPVAAALARELGLHSAAAPHRRMAAFAGRIDDLGIEVASHADFRALYEPAPLRHAWDRSVVVRLRFREPLPFDFHVDSSRGAASNADSVALGLHPYFKTWTEAPAALGRLFGGGTLGPAVNALFGATPDGSGRIVRLDRTGIGVYWSSPTAGLAPDLARALLRAARIVQERTAFVGPVAH